MFATWRGKGRSAGLRRFLVGNGVLAFLSVLSYLPSVGYDVVLGRRLSPSAYGTLSTLLAMASVTGILQLTLQLWAAAETGRQGGLSLAWRRRMLRAAGAMVGGGALLSLPLGAFYHLPPLSVFLVGVMGAVWIYLSALRGVCQGREDFWTFGISLLLETGTRFVSTLMLPATVYGGLLGLLLGSVVSLGYLAARVQPYRPSALASGPPAGFAFSVGVIAVATLLPSLDLAVLRHVWSPVLVGHWSAVRLLGKGLAELPALVGTVLFPRVVRDPEDSPVYLRWALALAVGLLLVSIAGLEVLLPHLLDVVFAGRYRRSLALFQSYLPASVPMDLTGLWLSALLATGNRAGAGWLAAAATGFLVLLLVHHAGPGTVLVDLAALGALEIPLVISLLRTRAGVPASRAGLP